MRFNKRIKIAPGVRINLSASGVSTNVGVRDASLSMGKRGAFLNTSIPVPGLSSRRKLSGSNQKGSGGNRTKEMANETRGMQVEVTLEDDGSLNYIDESTGYHLDDGEIRKFKAQHGDHIRELLDDRSGQQNCEQKTLRDIHLLSPALDGRPIARRPNPQAEPIKPDELKIPFMTRTLRWFKTKRLRREHEDRVNSYFQAHRQWAAIDSEHEQREGRRFEHLHKFLRSHHETVERYFAACLKSLDWPRETIVEFSVSEDLTSLAMDIDLPEVEDMPTSEYRVHATQWRIVEKELTQKQLRLDYASHIHGVVFRLLSEAFACLPTVTKAVCSGYTQRRNIGTNILENQYVLSVEATRAKWQNIDFSKKGLRRLDPVDHLPTLQHSRKMSTTGVLKSVDPIQADLSPEENDL